MAELTELERLEKKVVDTQAAWDVAYAAADAAWDTFDTWDAWYDAWHDACDAEVDAAWVALKARDELEDYLKEQDNEPAI